MCFYSFDYLCQWSFQAIRIDKDEETLQLFPFFFSRSIIWPKFFRLALFLLCFCRVLTLSIICACDSFQAARLGDKGLETEACRPSGRIIDDLVAIDTEPQVDRKINQLFFSSLVPSFTPLLRQGSPSH
jgi:hypothetical protein